MPEFSLTSPDFEEGGEIPRECGKDHGNTSPALFIEGIPPETKALALIMDDPDAMAAVGKVWVHWLYYEFSTADDNIENLIHGKTDFDESAYGGPAPPDKRHRYVFKGYALDNVLELKEGYSKQELEDAMKGHIIAEAKLTGTFAP